ncbi:MAG: ankyrin repeat domain-containing protein, partial [Acidobacteria bacterium]|nr:ankyrin repeat domain-containing protein [Acidobacteriota bacterium]
MGSSMRVASTAAAVALFLILAAAPVLSQTDSAKGLLLGTIDGNLSQVLQALSEGADVDSEVEGLTALHLASQLGHASIVEALVAADADLDRKTPNGATPLRLASRSGHVAAMEALLVAGANVDTQDDEGGTALIVASQEGHEQIVRILLDARADINLPGSDGSTP